jgi:hypothetical protein
MTSTVVSRRLLALSALLLLPALAHAQDPAPPARQGEEPARPSREAVAAERLQTFQEALDLTAEQSSLVERAMADPAPGALWNLAAALTPTLTAEQQDRLLTLPERGPRGERPYRAGRPDRAGYPDDPGRADRPDHAPRPDRAERPERAPRPDRAPRPGRDARPPHGDGERPTDGAFGRGAGAMREAMVVALGLSDEQVASLEALHRSRRDAPADASPPQGARGLPDEVAEILTPDQEAIWQVHHALAMRLHHPGPRH